MDNRITGLTRRFDEQNALIIALSSRVGFLEDELQNMDCRLARAGRRPPTPVPGPPPVVIDLTDLSDDEEDGGIMVSLDGMGVWYPLYLPEKEHSGGPRCV